MYIKEIKFVVKDLSKKKTPDSYTVGGNVKMVQSLGNQFGG